MRKKLTLLLALTAALVLLAGCKVSGKPLPEGMDATELITQGREVAAMLNREEWQEVYDLLREDARETTSPDAIRDYMEGLLDKAGAYVTESDIMTTGQKLKDTGEEYGTAVLYWKHEKKNLMYRVAYSTDMELMGIQITVR